MNCGFRIAECGFLELIRKAGTQENRRLEIEAGSETKLISI